MILTKNHIIEKHKQGQIILDGVNPEQISECSVDGSLGSIIFLDCDCEYVKNNPDEFKKYELITNPNNPNIKYYKIIIKYKPFELKPGMFVLAYIQEFIGTAPNSNLCMQFLLKSTVARHGLDHNLAGFIETGYFNRLCLELTSKIPIRIQKNMLIGQFVFHTTTEDNQDYTQKQSYQKTSDLQELKANWKPEDILPKPIKFKN